MTKEERLTMEEINTMNSNGDAVAIRRLLIEMYKAAEQMEEQEKREAKDDREGGNKCVPGQHVPSEPFQEDD